MSPDRHRWLRVLHRAVGDLVGSACVYGQVLKTRRNNRVIRVERRVKIGTASRLQAALRASEDSQTLNTSFVERLIVRPHSALRFGRETRTPAMQAGLVSDWP